MSESTTNSGYDRNNYMANIRPFIEKNIIKVIIGMRRSGKSFLLRQIINTLTQQNNVPQDQILYIDKESLAYDFLKTYSDLYKYVKQHNPKYLFVDEVQDIDGWEKAIASFNNEGIDTYITGSNATMLSSDLATHLAGRYITIPVYALSFQEFIQFHQLENTPSEDAFSQFLKLGGFPMLAQFSGQQDATNALIRDIFETIVSKDIISRHKVRRINLLRNIVHYAMDNIGNIFSAHKVTAYLKSQKLSMDPETVHDYLQHLASTFALHKVRRYDIHGKRHLEVSEKYYLGDLGLRHALLGYRENDISQYLENIVFLELLRRGYQISIGKLGDKEIDFIAEKQNQKLYIQVTYLLASQETFDREFFPLQQIQDAHPKLVLSMDTPAFGSNFHGIQRFNLIHWLLESE